ncbi:hypothetical protein SEVCU071_0431 [Staphylococcus epidermidis VCU071]|nr:hypothetical protein SEVCU071_0431 [Staphylococcus epidermidis VCU071]TIC92170.1 hypothetical protein SEVCU112_1453 [Staphylococcus epidermidis VCU112]TID00419.1 hypothetical protein HMPREF9955_0434 [Staphylococcus epidermidis FS1]
MKMINLIKINNLKQLHETNRNCYDLKIILNEAHAVVNINDNYFQLKE